MKNLSQERFDEIVNEVYKWYEQNPESAKREFRECTKEELAKYHFDIGRYIRNEFGLWELEWTPMLDEEQVDMSPDHPDNISGRILEVVWEKANNTP